MPDFYFDGLQIQLSWQSLLDNLPYSVGIKNANSEIIAANTVTAKLTGFKKVQDLLGLTDADLKCPAAEFYPIFYQQDQLALSGTEQKNLDIYKYADGQLHALISVKKKITDDNGNDFILISASELPISAILEIFKQPLFKTDGSYSIRHPVIHSGQTEYKLTIRQEEVLFYLLQGKTMKEIAFLLKIAVRTVEEHIKTLKHIFKCHSKPQLIEMAFQLGYACVIPPSLFVI